MSRTVVGWKRSYTSVTPQDTEEDVLENITVPSKNLELGYIGTKKGPCGPKVNC
jgi:hypothetical protein